MSDFLLGQARRMRDAGNLLEAARIYNDILRVDPRQFEALYALGSLYHHSLQFSEAERFLGAAVTVDPQSADAWFMLGRTLQRLKRLEDAIAAYDRAVAINPRFVDAMVNRCVSLTALSRDAEALNSIDAALAIDASAEIAWVYRGLVLHQMGHLDESLSSFDRAVDLKPDMVEARINRGSTLFVMKRYEGAVADYERAVVLAPDIPYLAGNLLHYRLHCCDWSHLEKAVADVAKGVQLGKRIILPFVHATISRSPAEQLQCARIAIAGDAPTAPALWRGERYDHDRIRVAYVSADFREHAVARLIAGTLEAHDRSRFELTALALAADDGSDMRARFSRACDIFLDIEQRSDVEAALLLREREIDIAVDLMGFTVGGRAGIFARRPAPIQVNFLGYPGTTGASYIDYIIADPIVIPDEHRRFYSEKVVTLPDSYQCNDSKRLIAEDTPIRRGLGLPERAFVFCCFNNSNKILPETFEAWMRLLNRVDHAVLWLLETGPAAVRNLRREAETRGVAPNRLIFAPHAPPAEHLARHRLADLFLDTLPYGAHTTASDALWAGLPVVTCLGTTFAGRVAASLLRAIGLPELVTQTLDEYEVLALKLARDPPALQALKARLAENRKRKPLFDTERFTRNLESAFLTMRERQRQGLPPQSFAVAGPGAPAP